MRRMEGQFYGIRVDDGKKILLVNESQECIKKAKEVVSPKFMEQVNQVDHICHEQVDDFLLEALQNPRDRLTILKLEQEIEKFMRNTKLHQFEFPPMASSYTRLAAHRVAQHYHLKTTVLECNNSTRVQVTKTPESACQAHVRLADLPAKVTEALQQPKVAIKQRSPPEQSSSDKTDSERSCKLESARTVEERKEEYNKARARIFRDELTGDNVRICCHIEVVRLDDLEEEAVKRSCVDTSRAPCKEKNDNSNSKSNTNVVAVFRDREKDSKDPDYDRSYDRYLQRGAPVAMQVMYTSGVPNYNVQQPPWMPRPMNYRPNIPGPQASVSFLMHSQHSMYPNPYVPPPPVPAFFKPPRFQPPPQPPQPLDYVQGRRY